MKNLKSLYLKNFQSHKDTRLDFHEKITMLIGESDTGKTSALRGIRLIVKNDPKGNAFISVGSTKATVGLVLEDDTEIVREKSKSINRYGVYEPDGTHNIYEKFGTDVPPQVWEALDYEPIFIDADLSVDLHFAGQLDGHFLVIESDASKAKIIDGVAKINVFNMGLRKKKTEITQVNNSIRTAEKEIAELDLNLAQIDNIDALETQLGRVDQLIKALQEKEGKLHSMTQLKGHLDNIKAQVNHEERIINDLKDIHKADSILSKMVVSQQKLNLLIQSANTLNDIENEMQSNLHILAYKERILTAESKVLVLESKMARLNHLSGLNSQYVDTTTRIQAGTDYVNQMSVIPTLESKLSEVQEKMERSNKLVHLQGQYQSISNDIALSTKTIQDLDGLEAANLKIYEMERKQYQLQNMTQLQSNFNQTNQSINQVQAEFDSLQNVNRAEEILMSLQSKLARQQELVKLNGNISGINNLIDEEMVKISAQKDFIDSESKAYTDAFKESKTCPLCFSSLNEDHLSHISNNL